MNNQLTATSKLGIIIQQDRVLDFIDGKTQRLQTPEEFVRQEIAKSLVREYLYEKPEIEVEFVVRWLPSRFRRIPAEDGVVFVDSADLTEVNSDLSKKIADTDLGSISRARQGWVDSHGAFRPNLRHYRHSHHGPRTILKKK